MGDEYSEVRLSDMLPDADVEFEILDTGPMIVAMMETKIGKLLDDRRRLCAERDRFRAALELIYANAVDSHPSARDYAGDVLHGAEA